MDFPNILIPHFVNGLASSTPSGETLIKVINPSANVAIVIKIVQ